MSTPHVNTAPICILIMCNVVIPETLIFPELNYCMVTVRISACKALVSYSVQ